MDFPAPLPPSSPCTSPDAAEKLTPQPDYQKAEAFLITEKQAVVVGKEVWHWTPMPLENETSIICSFAEDTHLPSTCLFGQKTITIGPVSGVINSSVLKCRSMLTVYRRSL